MLGMTVACLYGVLRGVSPPVRMGSAVLWILAVVAVSGSMVPPQVGLDFKTFVDGAELLFGQHQSPYLNIGTTAFPFPTFSVVRAMSLNGRLSFESTMWSFFFLQASLLALSYVLVRKIVVQEGWQPRSDLPMALIQAGLLFHPAVMLALYYGQSSVLAGAFLVAAVWCWRCTSHAVWQHAAAVSLNLAWMTKPQLLMAAAYFVASWLLSFRRGRDPQCSAAAIGRLIGPWCVALIVMSLALDVHGHAAAYRDFFSVASSWFTVIALVSPNNYAMAAIVAKAVARYGGFPVLEMLEILTALGAGLVLVWNLVSLRSAPRGALLAFLPWLLGSLLWTSLMWRFYLSLIIAGVLLLVASEMKASPVVLRWRTVWVAGGIGLTMVLGSFAFTVGILLLYFFSHELLAGHDASGKEASTFSEESSVNSACCLEAGRTISQ